MSWHTHIHRPAVAVAAALAAATAIAACGGSSPPSTTTHTTASGSPPKDLGQAAYQFSSCMRSHGVSKFPDPQVSQHGNQASVVVHITPAISSSPAFQSAQKACAHYLPEGGGAHPPTPAQLQKQRQAALAFANCMRGHGFPEFPDPTAQGQLNPRMVSAAGIDLHQPALLHAGLACVSVTHGLLTPADIEHAVNGNGG